MAGTIKGISVLISGDTVDLKKSLGDVEKTSKSLQSELNQVNKQLKFDPQNTVLLAQKQELLEEKIANTKLTLEKLESVREQIEEQAQKGDLGTDKFRAYQREVETTKGILHNLEKQLQDTQAAQNDLEKASENVDFSKFEKEIDNVKQSVSGLKDTLKGVAGDVGKGFVAAGGAAAAAIKSYDSVESALNSIQAQTGASESEMMKFKSTLENVYSGNYGENMQDIANVMSAVVQFTGEMDAGKVQSITESVFALSDSFQYDYAESLRAMNMLISQFGLSSEEAFNLIAQGTQKGLNKNGDLLDSINEYAVHYKQLGYTAEEFFNSLENGSEAGTFSVDKLGDAMKEFGIRSKDTANTTTEGFEIIGLNADKMREAFAKGGDSAKDATNKTLDALFNLKDEVKQNQAGVDLFGTMWEDLGIDGVKALMNVSGEADKTKNSMEKIKDVKYEDLGNKLGTLGRKMQTEVINPAIEDFYPEAEKFIDWAADNIDSIIPLLEMVGKQVAIIWGTKKTTEIIKRVKNLVSNYKDLSSATKLATDGQNKLNFAQKANVVAIVTGAVFSLVSAIDSYNEAQWENSSLKKELDKTKELTDEWNNLADEMSNKVEEINDKELNMKVNFQEVDKMKERLQEIIADGTIDESEKGEYKTIVDLLSEKVDGFDKNWNNLTLEEIDGKIVITDNIDEVNTKLDNLIANWEIAQAKTTLTNTYSNLQTELAKKKADLEAAENSPTFNSLKEEFSKFIYEKSNLSQEESEIFAEALSAQEGDYEKAAKILREKFLNETLDKEKYSNLYSDVFAPLSNKSVTFSMFGFNDFNHEVNKRVETYIEKFKEHKKALSELKTQYDNLKRTYNNYGSALETINGGQKTYNDYIKLSTDYGLSHDAVLSLLKDDGIKTWSELEAVAKEQTKSMGLDFESLQTNTANIITNIIDTINNNDWIGLGVEKVRSFFGGFSSKGEEGEKSGESAGTNVQDGIEKVDYGSTGESAVSKFLKSVTDKAGIVLKECTTVGKAATDGVTEGINNPDSQNGLFGAISNICSGITGTFKRLLGINSPSREAKKIGKFFTEGLSIGISENAGKVNKTVTELSESMLKSLDTKKINNALNSVNSLRLTASSDSSSTGSVKKIINSPNISVNINGAQVRSDSDIDAIANKVSEKLGNMITKKGMEWG